MQFFNLWFCEHFIRHNLFVNNVANLSPPPPQHTHTPTSCFVMSLVSCSFFILNTFKEKRHLFSNKATNNIQARFLSLAQSKLRLCSANHRTGYFSNLACDWLSIVWAYSDQETENRPSCFKTVISVINICNIFCNWLRRSKLSSCWRDVISTYFHENMLCVEK